MLSSDDKSLFQKGSFVEVSSDSDGFTGVWYVAKVLEPPSVHLTPTTPDKGTREERFFHIEYQSLLCDDGSEKPLTEYVESSFVRPLPPNDEHDLQVYDVVDAMYLDGWWIGVVVKVNHESNVYSVYFENPPDLLHLRRYELRAHWDWEGGKWVRPQKQVPKVGGLACRVLKDAFDGMEYYEEQSPYSGNGETDIIANCSRELRLDWSSPSTENSSGKKMKEVSLSLDAIVSLPLKNLKLITKKKGRAGCSKRKRGEGQKTLVKCKKLDKLSDLFGFDTDSPICTGKFKQTKHDGNRESKCTKHDGAEDAVDKSLLKDHEIFYAESKENTEKYNVRKHDGAEGSLDKLTFKDHAIDAESAKNTEDSEGTKNDGAGGAADNMVLKYSVIIDASSPTNTAESKGKKHNESVGSADKFVLKDPCMADSVSPVNTGESNHIKHAIVVVDVESPKNTEESEGTNHDGAAAAAAVEKMALKYPLIFDAESCKSRAESKDNKCDGAGVAVNKMDSQDCASSGVESSKITGESTGFSGSEDASAEKAAKPSDTVCSTREAEMAIVEVPGDMDTIAKPISVCFDGLCSQKIVIDSKFCGMDLNQSHRNYDKGKLIEIVKESTANDEVSDRIRGESECFSCMEPSSMWKTFIETLEVLETMPQKPHFHPLKQCKEMYRDGLAFGYMITFAKVVKRTSELQVDDPKSVFDSISETLHDIELHGFDVQPIRNRLTELQLMKDRQEQLQEAMKEFEHRILQHTHELTKINAEFAEIVEEIKMLEGKKRKIMLLMQENDLKITELKSNLDVCNQNTQNAQLDFESLAAAPW
ncbi:uncharacterized protein LOC123202265 isoform X3 [Mangifera indica]|uniref:uncharacterized protein LOC123202265 isoform X3 n=1 Tax=Mangifera indica TaxID=29780 RepID=UPI001CF9DA78|nr:uncharacterized protein LOC123202265 isoform X3 [Mangifera indica]